MKKEKIFAVLLSVCCFCFIVSASKANNYIRNKAPLVEVPFTPLPIGSVKAEGWLLERLRLQKDGLTGHAETLYSGNNDLGAGCDWLGGTGDSWERAPYYVKGLVALAYVLDDEELKTKAQKWIDWSLDNQRRTGFFGPVNNTDWWARMPMLYAIRDFYDATGDERVIPFFRKYFQYQHANIDTQLLSSWGKSRAGDNIEIVFWLYNRTGDAFLLELADKLYNQAYPWTDIFTRNLFNQFGRDFQPKHNVNVPQAMKLPPIYFQKSRSKADREAYIQGRNHLNCDHRHPCGMGTGNEMLPGRSSMAGLELCSVVEQMQSSETAQMILGDASIGDQLEMVAFNALPGGLTSDIKGLQYYQQANQVISKLGYVGFAQNYDNGNVPGPYSGYGCCRFDFHMGYPYFVKHMWAATSDNGLAAMAYGPSSVTARVADGAEVSIRQQTDYPFGEQLRFTLTMDQTLAFPLKFRIPVWCDTPEIKVNGKAETGIEAGSFYTINRSWKNKDVITIHFPMPIVVNEEVNNSVSIQRGPLVFALKIDENRVERNNYGNGFTENEVLPSSAWNYALLINKDDPESSIRVVESAMPENPYVQATSPVKLIVSAKKVPAWSYAHNGRIAIDPPYSPVNPETEVEELTLVPYGAETLRATCLPYVGVENLITSSFAEDFTNGGKGWVQYGGSFYIKDDAYIATNVEASHPCSKSVHTATQFSDFIYEADVQLNSEQGNAGLMFRVNRVSFGPDDYDGYYVGLDSENNKVELGKANGSWHALISSPVDIDVDRWYHIKLVANGTNIKVYVDNMLTPKIDYSDASFSSGSVGLRSWSTLARWDNISVSSTGSTGTETVTSDKDLRIYPNPVADDLVVTIARKGYMLVYDASGKQLFSADVLPGITTLNTKGYHNGIYFLKLITEEGTACIPITSQLKPGGAFGLGNNESNLMLINTIAHNNLSGDSYNSLGQNDHINGGGIVISRNSAIESASTKLTDGDDINHMKLTCDMTPDFLAPAAIIGYTADESGMEQMVAASYHLSANSRCIDAGDISYTNYPVCDLGVQPRLSGTQIDMGAYEFQSDETSTPSLHLPHISTLILENKLHVSGGEKGQQLKLFNIEGILVHAQEIAGDNEAVVIPLGQQGIYFMQVNPICCEINEVSVYK